ncbi:hypothetical protein [Thalassospira mesophila]|uniref:Uncharacterized protein n=1 Tax=Thalassospira mesophila TaxID=1293891 RepID=A0A1Y2L6N8_9PROT|nr:hypothetical protein [Thalassospira mesophila]OSQ40509.1 hypothetical protein TMES_01675 [Thalassospira mesophila]
MSKATATAPTGPGTMTKAPHPSFQAVSDIIVKGAAIPAGRGQAPTAASPLASANHDDLLLSFIVWNIETGRTARPTLFSHWLDAP